MTGDKTTGLGDAYAVSTPDENRALYDAWAEKYDASLSADYDYVYPLKIADLFEREGGVGPILDIGCGTGLVGAALHTRPVDGLDISSGMLEAARAKGIYRNLIEADLTGAVDLPDGGYRGVVSAGTFTVGHLGPEALGEPIRLAAPGALFVIGVNEMTWSRDGFPEALNARASAGEITEPRLVVEAVYGGAVRHEHSDNRFVAAIFRRSGDVETGSAT